EPARARTGARFDSGIPHAPGGRHHPECCARRCQLPAGVRTDRAARGRYLPDRRAISVDFATSTENEMRPPAASALGVGLLVLAGCGDPKPDAYQGYVEGEYVLLAAPYGGALVALDVARGQTVASGAPLFTLEQGNEVAGKQEAEERMRAAQARF